MSTGAVSVVGCGKLGCPLIAVLAASGYNVTAIDSDKETVGKLSRGIAPVNEPDLQALITGNLSRINATPYWSAIAETDATFVVVPTPSAPDGTFSNKHVIHAVYMAARSVKNENKKDHLFVVNSTTTPGSIDKDVLPVIQTTMRKSPFEFAYNPLFIALGSVIRDLRLPDFVLIGANTAYGSPLSSIWQKVTGGAPVQQMTVAEAELCKLSVNAFVTMKISFGNQIQAIAERMGFSAEKLLRVVGRDQRVGERCMKPGLPFGGPCFPRDNKCLQSVASAHSLRAHLAAATDTINSEVASRIAAKVAFEIQKRKGLAVLGIGYKEGSTYHDGSLGLSIASAALAGGAKRIFVHDYSVENHPFPKLFSWTDIAKRKDIGVIAICSFDPRYDGVKVGKHQVLVRP